MYIQYTSPTYSDVFRMSKQYTVILVDARDLSAKGRGEAEARFARELESVLGGDLYVAETCAAWLHVSDSRADEIDRVTARVAARWPVALNAATQAGFSRIGAVGAAHFEVRLERSHAESD